MPGEVQRDEEVGEDIHANQAIGIHNAPAVAYFHQAVLELQSSDLDRVRVGDVSALLALGTDAARLGSRDGLQTGTLGYRAADVKAAGTRVDFQA